MFRRAGRRHILVQSRNVSLLKRQLSLWFRKVPIHHDIILEFLEMACFQNHRLLSRSRLSRRFTGFGAAASHSASTTLVMSRLAGRFPRHPPNMVPVCSNFNISSIHNIQPLYRTSSYYRAVNLLIPYLLYFVLCTLHKKNVEVKMTVPATLLDGACLVMKD